MSLQFESIQEGEPFTLLLTNNENQRLEMRGRLNKHLRNQIALIDIDFDDDKKLNFDNVNINLEYIAKDSPYLWRNVRIVNVQNKYVLQALGESVRHNRRQGFRVPLGKAAIMRNSMGATQDIMIHDVSYTGFSIMDPLQKLGLRKDDVISVSIEDLEYKLDLDGRVIRMEERRNVCIYGLEVTNYCRELGAYIVAKQRSKRKLS